MRGQHKVVRTLGLLVVVLSYLGVASAQTNAPAAKAPSWSWGGDMRLRLELADYGKPVHLPLEKGVHLRAKLGAKGELADGKLNWGFKLATMRTGRVANLTRNICLGGGNLSNKNAVGVDLAYLTFKPSSRVAITVGKQPMMFWGCDGMFSMADLTPEGLSVTAKLHQGAKGAFVGDVTNVTHYNPISESALVTADAFMLADQVKAKLGTAEAAVGCFWYAGMNNAPKYPGETYYFYPKDQMTVLQARVKWPIPGLKTFPVVLSAEAFDNVNIKQQAFGLEGRVDLPKVGKHGTMALTYRTVGRNATWDGWIEPNFGCNVGYKDGLRIEYTRPIATGLTWRLAGFRYTPTRRLPGEPADGVGRATGRFHCDLIYNY